MSQRFVTDRYSGPLPAPWPCTMMVDRPLAIVEQDGAPTQALTRCGRYLGRDLWRLDWLGKSDRVDALPSKPGADPAPSSWEQPALLEGLVEIEVAGARDGQALRLTPRPQSIAADVHDAVAQRWILRRDLLLDANSPLARFTCWVKLYRGRKLLEVRGALDWLDWPAGLTVGQVTVLLNLAETYRISLPHQARKGIAHRTLGMDWKGRTSLLLWDQRSPSGPDCRNLRDWSAMQGLYNGGGPLAGLYTRPQQEYYRAHPQQFAAEFPTMVDTANWPTLAGTALSFAAQLAGREPSDPAGYAHLTPETLDTLAEGPVRFRPSAPRGALAALLRDKFRAETWQTVDAEGAPHLCPTRIVDQTHGGLAGQRVGQELVLYRNGHALAHYFPSQLVEWAEWSADPQAESFARLAIDDLLNLFYDHRDGRLRRGNYFGQSGSNWWFLPDPTALLLAGWYWDDRRAAAAYLAHTAASVEPAALARFYVEKARRARCQSLVSALIGWDANLHPPAVNEKLAEVTALAAAILMSLDSDPRHDGASPLWDGRLPLLAGNNSPRTRDWLLAADQHPQRHLAGHGACHLLGLDVLTGQLLRSVPALREWAALRTGNHFAVWMAQVFGLFPHLARAAERAGVDLDAAPQPDEPGNYPCRVGRNNWVFVLVPAGQAARVTVDWQLRAAGAGVYCGYLDRGQDVYVIPPLAAPPARGAVWNPANLPRAVRATGRDVYRHEFTLPAAERERLVQLYLYTATAACLPMAGLTELPEALRMDEVGNAESNRRFSLGSALFDELGAQWTLVPRDEPAVWTLDGDGWLGPTVDSARTVANAANAALHRVSGRLHPRAGRADG